MRVIMVLLAMLASLLGCSTPQERAQRDAEKRQAEMALAVTQYGPACKQVGYTENTDPWRSCVMQQAAANNASKGWLSTSIFGSWFGGRGGGAGAGVGVGVGR